MAAYKVLSTVKVFGGTMSRVQHASAVTKCDMIFAVFMPEAAEGVKVPALYYLSGLTCTDENFMGKAGAQQAAAKHGIALIAPDTSPRASAVVTHAPASCCAAPACSAHPSLSDICRCRRRLLRGGLRLHQGRWL
jgi:S-formylglutathione hydrolase FrmB|eukprot:COSAG06_NODE_1372_length_9663_cov_5.356232_9_plen_135_part_00